MVTRIAFEFARAELARAKQALMDPQLPNHEQGYWRRIRRESMRVIAAYEATEVIQMRL